MSNHAKVSVIAIDGPAASGKSAIGQEIARRLGYRFLDTGAMYRAVTWQALRRGVPVDDEPALAHMAAGTRIDVHEGRDGTHVFVDRANATPYLRTPEVEANVSLVSRIPAVRAELVRIQRELAASGGVVMAGRDIGTVVLPDAGLKLYLDASRAVRARRRAEQLRASGESPDIEALDADLARRDGIDAARETSPLTADPEAVIIDTDELSIEEVIERVLNLAM
jgi:cytidylate kinase